MKKTSCSSMKAVIGGVIVCLLLAGQVAKADFVFGEPTSLGLLVNSQSGDYDCHIASDGLSLIFTSQRSPGGGWSTNLWMTSRATEHDDWGPAQSLGDVINSEKIQKSPWLSADGLELYYAQGIERQENIVVSRRNTPSEPWGIPENLGAMINSPATDSGPSLTADGLELYFDSSRSGRQELYVSTRATVYEPWGQAMNLGPTVNSTYGDGLWGDGGPSISPDGLTLLFNSARPPGATYEQNLWMTRRSTRASEWDPPVLLTLPEYSAYGDLTPSVGDGTLYFGSSRSGRMDWDLWQVPMLPVVDFNNDGKLDSGDVHILRSHWGLNEPLCDIGPTPLGDGIIDIQDLNMLQKYVDVTGPVVVHSPSSQSTDVPIDVILHWLPGEFADTHNVYFGSVFEDVKLADSDHPMDVLISQGQDANAFDPMGLIECGQMYYWRVDEISTPPNSSIYRGFVWSFTTEPFSYPLENVTATASSSSAKNTGPERTIDGSGLNTLDQHSALAADMWLSGMGDPAPSLQYDFDKAYKLDKMLVWNSNQLIEPFLGFGAKDVVIEISVDGTEWTVLQGAALFNQATGTETYTANTSIDFAGALAQSVRLTINTGWGAMPQYGLSEVRFFYIPVHAREPQPAAGATADTVDIVLKWHAGREAISHEVYLGTDAQDLTLLGTTDDPSFDLSGQGLEPGSTYYWRIDEINETAGPSIHTGDVWSFSTPD
jgi:Tol biopolymer transport system component